MRFKIRPFIAASVVLFGWMSASAQWQLDTAQYRNVVRFDALQALIAEDYLVSYERVVKRDLSFVFTVGYLGGYWEEERTIPGVLTDRSYFVRNGIYIAPEFRFYLTEFTNQRRPVGAYLSLYPFTQLSWINQRGELPPPRNGFLVDVYPSQFYRANYDRHDHLYGLSSAIGLQLFVLRGLTLEAQVNISIAYRDFEQRGYETDAFGVWQEANRKQFNREFLSGARFFFGYAF